MQLSASKEMITTTKSIHTIQNTQKQSSQMQIKQKTFETIQTTCDSRYQTCSQTKQSRSSETNTISEIKTTLLGHKGLLLITIIGCACAGGGGGAFDECAAVYLGVTSAEKTSASSWVYDLVIDLQRTCVLGGIPSLLLLLQNDYHYYYYYY